MALTYDDSVFNFDLNILRQSGYDTALQIHNSKPNKSVLRVKERIIATELLIKRYSDKKALLHETERKLQKCKDECKQTCFEYRDALKKITDFESEVQSLKLEIDTLNQANRELRQAYNQSEAIQDGLQSYINQLQLLIKEHQDTIEGLKIETKLSTNTIKHQTKDKEIAALKLEKNQLYKHVHIFAQLLTEGKNLNKSDKALLKLYKKSEDTNSNNTDTDEDELESLFEDVTCDDEPLDDKSHKVNEAQCTEDTSNQGKRKDITIGYGGNSLEGYMSIKKQQILDTCKTNIKPRENENLFDPDSDASNEVAYSIDTGCGSSVASDIEKGFSSPEYTENNTILSLDSVLLDKNVTSVVASPVTVCHSDVVKIANSSDNGYSSSLDSSEEQILTRSESIENNGILTTKSVLANKQVVKVVSVATSPIKMSHSDICDKVPYNGHSRRNSSNATSSNEAGSSNPENIHNLSNFTVKKNVNKVINTATSPIKISRVIDIATSPIKISGERKTIATQFNYTPQKGNEADNQQIPTITIDEVEFADNHNETDTEVRNILAAMKLDFDRLSPIAPSPVSCVNSQRHSPHVQEENNPLSSQMSTMMKTIIAITSALKSHGINIPIEVDNTKDLDNLNGSETCNNHQKNKQNENKETVRAVKKQTLRQSRRLSEKRLSGNYSKTENRDRCQKRHSIEPTEVSSSKCKRMLRSSKHLAKQQTKFTNDNNLINAEIGNPIDKITIDDKMNKTVDSSIDCNRAINYKAKQQTKFTNDNNLINAEIGNPIDKITIDDKMNKTVDSSIDCNRAINYKAKQQTKFTNDNNLINAEIGNPIDKITIDDKMNKTVDSSIDCNRAINYNDLDIFNSSTTTNIDVDHVSQNDYKQNKSIQKGFFITMLEKYAKKVRKQKKPLSEKSIKIIYENLEENIGKIIDLPNKEVNDAMKNFAESLQNINEKCFVSALITFLRSPKRKDDIVCKINLQSAPSMSKSEQVLLYILDHLKTHWAKVDIYDMVLKSIEYTLFKLNVTPDFDEVENLSHFYAVLCRFTRAKSRLRLFMLDAMYCLAYKAVPLIKQCLDVWMHILPLANLHLAQCPLVLSLVYLLHFYRCEDYNGRVQTIRLILYKRYSYQMSEWNETKIFDLLKKTLFNLREIPIEKKMVRLSLILIAKRHGVDWCQKNIVKKLLLPIIENKSIAERIRCFCVSVLGTVLRPYPKHMKVHCEIVLNQLFSMLDENPSPQMQEAVFNSLIYLSKHNNARVLDALISWRPHRVSPVLEELLKDFIQEKSPKTLIYMLSHSTQ